MQVPGSIHVFGRRRDVPGRQRPGTGTSLYSSRTRAAYRALSTVLACEACAEGQMGIGLVERKASQAVEKRLRVGFPHAYLPGKVALDAPQGPPPGGWAG